MRAELNRIRTVLIVTGLPLLVANVRAQAVVLSALMTFALWLLIARPGPLRPPANPTKPP